MTNLRSRLLRYAGQQVCSLDKNEDHIFAAGFALNIFRIDAVYTFIPKNACSTMRYSIALENGAISDRHQYKWIHANNQTFNANLSELAKAKYTFVILRDPYRRLVSCYLDKIIGQQDAARTFMAMVNHDGSIDDITFRQFVSGISSHLSGNIHWQPQIRFLVYNEYDDYFSVENFSEVVDTLKERFCLKVVDTRKFVWHGNDYYRPIESEQNFSDTPAFEFKTMKKAKLIPRYAKMYDRELTALTEHLYQEDFTLYREKVARPTLFQE